MLECGDVIQSIFDVSPELFMFVCVRLSLHQSTMEVVCLRSHSFCLMGGMFEPQRRNVL